MPSAKHLTKETHLNSSESQSTSSADATEEPMLIPDIRASLVKTYKTKPTTLSHHEITIAADGKKLILERYTWSVKLYSPDMKLLSRIQLEPPVRDIAIDSENQALVTTDDVIYFVDFSNDKLSVRRTLNSTKGLYGITKCKEHIYVTCANDSISVQMLDIVGNIHWSASKGRKENTTCYNPASINSFIDNGLVRLVVIQDSTINILDGRSGDVLSTRNTKFGSAFSVAVGKYNNVYICYPSAGVISILRSDLSNERVLITSKSSSYKSSCPSTIPRDLQDNPTSIAYDQNSNQLVICDIGGKVQIYQLNTFDE